ncbi:hypothetical protein RclHR1_00590037 [Rhizophagus clarus]|uniref:Serine-threonine/tyrosine-protein kinase catalytic domain-containing protein n=1 Tax=Rhizophagus clarus TaxID=94130 RepID=A0A2Z6RRC5_9GLOM|nr:hypothetical protein RclHR1_00590037 [Rhizophagus clarus]
MIDVHIISSNTQCTEHEPRNLDFYTKNIQEWCINCSEILYFNQIITKYSFDKNYYHENQNEITKYEKGCKLCGYQQNLLNNIKFNLCSNCYLISSGRIESILTEINIPILYLSWWYDHKQCVVCKHILKDLSVPLPKKTLSEVLQKWCSNCFTIYVGYVHITTSNTHCTDHIPRNLDFHTQNIQEWCINCSEISYFNQIITQDSFYMKKQIELIQNENYLVSFGYKKSILTKKTIPILYLPWWDTFSYCIVYKKNLEFNSNYQKWCSYCCMIYNGCRYCLTTNIIFGITNQSQCIKCERISLISINGNCVMPELLNFMVDINDRIINYMKNVDKDKNPLEIYNFINDKLENIKNIKMIEYSETGDFKKNSKRRICKDFVNELKSFYQYHNRFEHVIKYHGFTQDPKTKDHMIIMEYANGGDLHGYLQKNFTKITW